MYQKIKLTSKRNQVERIITSDLTFINKTFYSKENLIKEREILILLKSSGVNVPAIIDLNENSLMLEDLGDLTFLRWYENAEKQNLCEYEEMIMKLCIWLKSFYSSSYAYFNKSYILNDVNFRNFLIKDNEVYGIDFELVESGSIETDVGKMLAYALTYNPVMTKWKIKFHDIFVNLLSYELHLDKNLIIEEKCKELELIKKRRKIQF